MLFRSRHQVRWARTIRACRPVPFFLSILSNGTLWSVVALGGAWISHASPWPWLALLAGRIGVAWSLHRRMCPEDRLALPVAWVWVRDLVAAAVWAAAFLGSTVEWRGRRFTVRPDGMLSAR